jgi:hypothetical protein
VHKRQPISVCFSAVLASSTRLSFSAHARGVGPAPPVRGVTLICEPGVEAPFGGSAWRYRRRGALVRGPQATALPKPARTQPVPETSLPLPSDQELLK